MFTELVYFKYGKYLKSDMLEKDKIQYIAEKRRKLIFSLVLVAVFGSILYISGVIHEQEKNVEEAASGGLFDIAKKLEDEVSAPDEKRTTPVNLLKAPVSLLYSVENDKIKLKESLRIGKKIITDGSFTFDSHGDTLYSTGFMSKGNSFFCKGGTKSRNDRFFIYFCSEKTP